MAFEEYNGAGVLQPDGENPAPVHQKKEEEDLPSFADLFAERGMSGHEPKQADINDSEDNLDQLNYPTEPQDKLDLHGEYVDTALYTVETFINECRARGLSFVLIITGRGKHTEGGKSPVRESVRQLLQDMEGKKIRNNPHNFRTLQKIKFYEPAKPHDGGRGAFYVYLR